MVDKPAVRSRILRIIMAVILNFLLLLPIHLANLFGCPRNRMSSPLVEKVPNRVPVLTSRIDIAKKGGVETDLLGGIIVTMSTQPTIDLTEILGGTSLLGRTETCPNGTGTIVLGGTRKDRFPKGVVENGTIHHRRVITKLQA